MPSDRSVIIVNYFSADHTAAAVASLDAASSSPLEITVVDNSMDAMERAKLQAIRGIRVIHSEVNSGYAGGINRGLDATSGAFVIVTNPDVVFREGSIDRLIDAIEDGAALAGPRLEWDDAGEWLLPPADLMTAAMKLDEVVATRSGLWARARDRRRMRARMRFWASRGSVNVAAVSGAVMAFRRDLADRIGRFDERFPLYFEEIDFMRRVLAAGGKIVYASDARCRHIYNQSAGTVTDASSRFAISEAEYHKKWHGAGVRKMLRHARHEPRMQVAFTEGAFDQPIAVPDAGEEYLVEASTDPWFRTAAGHFPRGSAVTVPGEIAASLGSAPLFVRIVHRPSLRICGRYKLAKPLE